MCILHFLTEVKHFQHIRRRPHFLQIQLIRPSQSNNLVLSILKIRKKNARKINLLVNRLNVTITAHFPSIYLPGLSSKIGVEPNFMGQILQERSVQLK